MKACIKCGGSIPNRVVVDGKERNLQSRKFCLICSPFGQHNTSKYPWFKSGKSDKPQYVLRVCPKHGECTFILRTTGQYRCKRCAVVNTAIRRKRNKCKVITIFGGSCELCGYNKSIHAMQFHHLDRKEKSFQISSTGRYKAFDQMLIEACKCVLLCGNCHAEVEDGTVIIPRALIRKVTKRKAQYSTAK